MGRKLFLWFVLLSFFVLMTSSVRRINSIKDLADNNIKFGKTFPRHGLLLLFWLSRNIQIDQNDVIQLVDIDPSLEDFGFHYYGNFDKTLPTESNWRYYTVGNLNPNSHPGSARLPAYVTSDFRNTRNDRNRNLDRIIVQSYRNTPSRVRRVYLSEHYEPNSIIEISPEALRQIRNIPTLREFLELVGYNFNTRPHREWPFRDNDPDGGGPGIGTVGQEKSSDHGNERTWLDSHSSEPGREGSCKTQSDTCNKWHSESHQQSDASRWFMQPFSWIFSIFHFLVRVIIYPFSLIFSVLHFLVRVIIYPFSLIVFVSDFLVSVIIYPFSLIFSVLNSLTVVMAHSLSLIWSVIVYLLRACIALLITFFIFAFTSHLISPPQHPPRPQPLVSH
ncbi:hypothetical protein ACEWY4_012149 [Coilia grayii]|uniref:Uncharacterized protein n=1 Tax=Coilia grayii TaxID=363190 RepID=A0ABD1JZN9_9TELE